MFISHVTSFPATTSNAAYQLHTYSVDDSHKILSKYQEYRGQTVTAI
jgi:hypothetical protein